MSTPGSITYTPVLIVSEKTWLQDGFFEEALDPSIAVGDDDPELQRVLDRLQREGRRRPLFLVELDEPGQVKVAEGIAGNDDERVVEIVAREPHRSAVPAGDSSTEYSMFAPMLSPPRNSSGSTAGGRRLSR